MTKNLWSKATTFMDEVLPTDFEDAFSEKCKEFGLNENDEILFAKFVSDAINLKTTIARLKNK